MNRVGVRVWKLCLIGAAAGAANGLFGAGGGLVAVPLLTDWVGLPPKEALADSVAIMTPLCAVSLTALLLKTDTSLWFAWPYWVGGTVGGVLAGPALRRLPIVWLRRLTALFLLYGGLRAVLLL